jgi:para-nitrobenzyl esterase
VPLVFDTVSTSPAIAAAANSQAVADQMSDAWIAFARAGNPNTPRLPFWPIYTLERRATMIFNAPSRIEDDYGKQARLFWETA